MCGILGVYSRNGVLPERELFARALDMMRNRGPDDSDLWSEPQIQLGQRRLAIVELSDAGRQPMRSSDGRYVITFNGEIYNHREIRAQLTPEGGWHGNSDTETLLESYAAWGIDCVHQLDGMFAFAIWDRKERRLFAARDRLGMKPLYYHWRDDHLIFGSRPSPLTALAGVAAVDNQALRLYFDLGYIPAPLSLYENIRKLPQAHYLVADERGLKIVRYWDYRHIAPDEGALRRPEAELEEELDVLIREAVQLRLMSDVPLGAFLSGGTDSALVVAAMKAVGVEHPSTFTIGFREPAYDESRAAARIASHLGVDHTHEILSMEDLLQLLPHYIAEFDEPLSDNSAFATMAVARLARRHVTVALTGDGGDELFAGYPQYRVFEKLTRMASWPESTRRILRNVLAHLPWHNGKLLAGALRTKSPIDLFAYLRGLGKDFGPTLSDALLIGTQGGSEWFERHAASFVMDLDAPEIGMRLDLGFTLPDDYLQKVDVATMAFSLEARCPLLGYRLVEWALRLPAQYKLRGGESKYLLKKVLLRYLPHDMVYQPKKGFGVPVDQWLRGPLRVWALQLLHESGSLDRLGLQKSKVHRLFDDHVSGRRNAAPLLWAILMLLCFVSQENRRVGLPDLAQRRAA